MFDWYFFLIISPACVALFFMLRNVWLFNRLTALPIEDQLKIKAPFKSMVFRFWVWDVRKFMK
jgi:hypothetical protein